MLPKLKGLKTDVLLGMYKIVEAFEVVHVILTRIHPFLKKMFAGPILNLYGWNN